MSVEEKEKDTEKETRDIQLQWYFVAIASFLAIFLGMIVSALYDLIEPIYSPWGVFLFFGILSLLFIDIFTYFFENLDEIRKNPNETFFKFLRRYTNMRLGKVFRKK